MLKPILIGLVALFPLQSMATFCHPGYIIYHAEEKARSLFTKDSPASPLRLVELCKQPDGYAFYLGSNTVREVENEFIIPTYGLKVEPESPKGGFNFTHNNIEYSLFEDDISILYVYNADKELIDVIELDNRASSYSNRMF